MDKNFRLLSLDAPLSSATVGDHFSSTGSNILSMRFFDSSVVVEAERGKRFGFDTESRLERKHRPTWRARFVNRYVITPAHGGGATLSLLLRGLAQNYILVAEPALRPMMRVMVPRSMRKNMRPSPSPSRPLPINQGSWAIPFGGYDSRLPGCSADARSSTRR